MLPPFVINAILVLIAVLVVLLLVRVAWRRFLAGGDTVDDSTGSPVEVPVSDLPDREAVVAPVTEVAAVDTTERAVHASTAAVDDAVPEIEFEAATSKPVAGEDVPEGSPVPPRPHHATPIAAEATGWRDRSLFDDHENASDNDLPYVTADSVPHAADDDDYVFGPGLTRSFAALLPESAERRAESQRELLNAGYYEPQAWQNLAAIRYIGIVLALVFFGTLLLILPEEFELYALAGVVLGPLLAWSIPRLMVRGKAQDRLNEIERGMPDMLDMLNMCVSQGLTVQQSMGRISRQLYGPYPALGEELAIVVEQSRIGTLEHSLRNFEQRVDVPEVHSFVALVTQTERMGTSVSDALVDYSDSMRESLRQRADNKANQATFKLLFPTVLCLMPAIYLILLGPALVQLTEFMEGGGLDAVTEGTSAVREVQ